MVGRGLRVVLSDNTNYLNPCEIVYSQFLANRSRTTSTPDMRKAEFHLGGKVWKAGLSKLKRSDVYGWSELDISDDKGRACTMATLVEGRHVLPSGSISMIKLNKAGEVVSSSGLVGVDRDGKQVPKHPSVYSGPVSLREGHLDDYLAMAVKAVYVLISEEESPFLEELNGGKLLQFMFNYREDYEADDAFMLSNGEDVFLVTGQIPELDFLAQQQAESPVEVETVESEEDLMDFSMF